ncbi:hypothetical protein HHI36_003488 [Cryptolaemus montrouzieri]|uniref:Major facilitator superfamily (MFS) profile domain-containing protein n=1 Tax=Cryptolaemus montrouzieri TaxID=559131 RepID=A0ABD2PEB2_9CUCU
MEIMSNLKKSLTDKETIIDLLTKSKDKQTALRVTDKREVVTSNKISQSVLHPQTKYSDKVSGPGGHHFLVAGKPEYIGQVLASLAVSLGPLAAGLGKGYSSPAIASLQERDADAFIVNGQQASWLASLSLLGALFGAPLGGAAVRWGRRRTLIYAGAPLSLCWIITVFSVSVEVMCLAAFVSGFLVAIVQLSAQVYVSEIATPSIRGGLSALLKIAGHAGVLVAFAAGAFLDWRQLAGLISLAPAAMCVAMWKIPESPGWLVLRGRLHEAEEALKWLRGEDADLRFELSVLQAHVLNKTVPVAPSLLINNLKTPVFIACGLMFFQRFSGANAFNFYIVSVFKETFGGTNPHSAAVAVAVVQLLSSLLSGLLVDIAGRLPLLVASSVLMSLALASFGSFAYYEDAHPKNVPNLDWIPLLCVLVFTVAFTLGISPISWLLVTELFSLEQRGLGTALATAFSYLCAFIGVKTFVDFQELFGLHGAFWLYAFISVCGLCFIVCCVPETKGRDLTEIDTCR